MSKAKKTTKKKTTKKKTTKKPGKATSGNPASRSRPVKPAAPRKVSRQPRLPGIQTAEQKEAAAANDLDALTTDAYEKTATYMAAKTPMNQARARLQTAMKTAGVYLHETDEGIVAKIKRSEEKLTLKREDKTVEIDEDDEGGESADVTEDGDD